MQRYNVKTISPEFKDINVLSYEDDVTISHITTAKNKHQAAQNVLTDQPGRIIYTIEMVK